MSLLPLLIFLLIGLLAGFLSGLLGIGGGVVVVPILLFVFAGMDIEKDFAMHLAIGTSLASMVITAFVSGLSHHRRGAVVWSLLVKMLPGLAIGCLIGAYLSDEFSGVVLEIIFGLFICLMGVKLLLGKRKIAESHDPKKSLLWLGGAGVGAISSLLGVGGGTFSVPLFLSFGYSEKKAIGTSAATSFVIATLGAIAYLYFGLDAIGIQGSFGYVYLPAFALIGIGSVFLAPIGVGVAHRMSGNKLRKTFAVLLLIIGATMLVR